jgi:magnesium transporter
MQREFVAVPEHMTVGDLIDYMREHDELPTEFWEVFVVDAMHKPVGTCALSWILRTPRGVALSDVMKRDQTLIPVGMDQEEVALRFQKYALISAAVVDESGRLVGQLTVDDIVHIISEEAGEDAMLLSGAGEGDINQPIREAYSGRVRWLLANLVTASVASFVISRFEGVIAQLVTLAVLMPIVAGIGGNAGTQTLAVTVRALATNQLTSSNTWRAVRREVSIALLNGVSIAVVIGAVVTLIFGDVHLGVVIGLAMMTNILIAGFAGVLVPLTLDKMRADPAIASSIFVTMTTDSMGFLVFLGLAVATRLVP